MINKKKPARTCMACQAQKEKQDLLRIVKSKDGLVEIDLTRQEKWQRSIYLQVSRMFRQSNQIKKIRKSFRNRNKTRII